MGIDVAQKELVVCLGCMYDDWTTQLFAHKTFANTAKGHTALILWVKKQTDETIAVRYIMEATGEYHESLAYFLDNQAQDISIVLPNKISNYFKTLDVKTITDKSHPKPLLFLAWKGNWKAGNVQKQFLKNLGSLQENGKQCICLPY